MKVKIHNGLCMYKKEKIVFFIQKNYALNTYYFFICNINHIYNKDLRITQKKQTTILFF